VKAITKLFELGYVFIVILFFACGIGLVVLAGVEIWSALPPIPLPANASTSSSNASAC
jgi:hypothetical protein